MTPSPPSTAGGTSRLRHAVEHPVTQRVIMGLIIVNAVVLGLETSPSIMAVHGSLLLALDQALLAVFVLEIAARIAVHRLAFFRDPWSVFDFIVVAIALIPASGPLAVLRALRVLRVLRLLSIVPSLRRVVGALLAAVPGLSSIGMVLGLVFYVFGVIATKLFGEAFPDWFGTLGRSLYTLFQVMTLESWSMGIARPVMEQFAYAWVFFVPFILLISDKSQHARTPASLIAGVTAAARTRRGTMARRSYRRLKRYCTSARYRCAYLANLIAW
jgi:voltage-gated sodium channel